MSICGSSCKKEKLLQSGGDLRFSTDTLSFDTVFTTLGSATLGLKIYNPQDQKINVSSVRLAGGSSSPFRLNVDGKAGDGKDVEIAAHDSIYVYATVKVDPTDANSPFFVEDRLVATLNGNDFSVPIIAYGQNAHYVRDSVLRTDTWKTDKPYVIMGAAVVDTNQTLTIPAGCRIYMHQNARLFVLGTLNAVGTRKDSIIFQGDRLDRYYFGYEGYPGEWGGIYFDSRSKDNLMRHVILANCGNGAQNAPAAGIEVVPDSLPGRTQPQVTLDKVTIKNSAGYGLLAFYGYIRMDNCLIHSCAADAVALVQGGNYELNNCTIATYGNTKIGHTDKPSLVISSNFDPTETSHFSGNLACTLRNTVVAGSMQQEFYIDSLVDARIQASVTLQNCLLKGDSKSLPARATVQATRFSLSDGTLDPQFSDFSKDDYHLKATSPLVDAGTSAQTPGDDLDDQARTIGTAPDIGCYEYRP